MAQAPAHRGATSPARGSDERSTERDRSRVVGLISTIGFSLVQTSGAVRLSDSSPFPNKPHKPGFPASGFSGFPHPGAPQTDGPRVLASYHGLIQNPSYTAPTPAEAPRGPWGPRASAARGFRGALEHRVLAGAADDAVAAALYAGDVAQ